MWDGGSNDKCHSMIHTQALKRVYEFLRLNVLFASLPLLVVWGIRRMASQPTPLEIFVPEFLFLSIMVGITVIEDIGDQPQKISNRMSLQIIRDALFAAMVLAIGLYVLFTYVSLDSVDETSTRSAVPWIAAILSTVICLLGVATEYLLAVISATNQQGRSPVKSQGRTP